MKRTLCLLMAWLLLMGTVAGCTQKPPAGVPGDTTGTDSGENTDTTAEVMPPEQPGVATLYDLRTEDMVEPIGVDRADPAFSWKMSSDLLGQHQTAYRIQVTAPDGSAMWDSGKQESGESVDIPYAGEALAASTCYRWDLTVWDKDDTPVTAHATFETGIFGKAGFEGASWISYGDTLRSHEDHYTIEVEFVLEQNSFGLCFGAESRQNMLMWQINTQASNGQRVHLRPHIMRNGAWETPVGDIDITTAQTDPAKGNSIIGRPMHMRIQVEGNQISTFFGPVGTTLVMVHRMNMEEVATLYTFGFRLAGASQEMAKVDRVLVRDKDGGVIYENDFTNTSLREFQALGGQIAVRDGRLCLEPAGGQDLVAIRQSSGAGLPVFRKVFTPAGRIVSAKLYTSGLGVYESYINGERVGRLLSDGSIEYHELKPGAAEATDRKYYSSYDVTHMFTETGEQVLSATMGTGWWSGNIVAGHGSDNEAYLAKLILAYEDGTTEIINTDTTWQAAHASPFVYSDIFGGEDYDARVDTSWMLPGYNAEQANVLWMHATVNTDYQGDIMAWMGSYIQVREDLEREVVGVTVYQGVTGAASNRYGAINVVRTYDSGAFTLNPGEVALVDFGQNAAGWEAFTVEGETGTVLSIRHGEMLNDRNGEHSRGNDGPGGSLYTANNRGARAMTVYTLAGGQPESYHPSFTYYGFRYIEITTTAPVTFSRMAGQVVTSVEKETGYIETSHKELNQLVSNILWSQYANYLSVPTDCAQRDERLGWMGDAHIYGRAASYFAFSKSFLEKYLQDVRDAQRADGAYAAIAPSDYYNGGNWGSVGWADAGIILPHTLYTMYDDRQIIEDHWDSMVRYMAYLAQTDGPVDGYGDWLSYEANDGMIQRILSRAYYAWDALLMADMAEVLGKTEEAEAYRALYEQQKQKFIHDYVDEKTGMLKRSEQTPCLYALYLDLLPDETSVEAVTKQLVGNITARGNLLQTGLLGTNIILHTLTKIGRTDLAYTLLLQTENPSWLYSVLQGATSVWERWNSYTIENGFGDAGMNSFNHYWYGVAADWMFTMMAGIDTHPDTPGFKHLLLDPIPDARIKTVKAHYDSAYGMITVESVYDETAWTYDVTIPANTTAELRMPMGDFQTVTVNGKAAEALTEAEDGIVFEGIVDGVAIFRLVSGHFAVECR